MKRREFWIFVAALVLMVSCAHAELTQADLDDWYGQMRYFVEEIGARQVNTPGEWEAADYIYQSFSEMGFDEDEGLLNEYTMDMTDIDNVQTHDFEAILPARENAEDAPIVIVGAHYDSWTPSARDNSSGIAAVLMLARRFSEEGPFENVELRFVAFSAEEHINHEGSTGYVYNLLDEEKERVVAMFNLDIVTVGLDDPDHVFSCDTMGMATENGYVEGSEEAPAFNRVAKAVWKAMEELGTFDMTQNGMSFWVPRHCGMSDHEAFHYEGIDAANVCFHGNRENGGNWPTVMHTDEDTLDDLDLPRSYQALQTIYTAVRGLALDPTYGSEN